MKIFALVKDNDQPSVRSNASRFQITKYKGVSDWAVTMRRMNNFLGCDLLMLSIFSAHDLYVFYPLVYWATKPLNHIPL